MKIICQKSVLAKAVGLAHNAVSSKSTLPILSNILFETNKKGVEVLGTDLEIGLRCFIEVEVVKPGAITIPAKKISDILRECPDQEVEISVDEGNRITIKCGKTLFKVMGLSREDFPNLPEIKNEKTLKIADKDLLDMIRKVHFAVSNDETRRVLNGALLAVEGDVIRMVSTDGHRLSLVTHKLGQAGEKSSAIVPGKTLNELLKILDGGTDEIEVTFTENHVFFKKSNATLATRLIDGQFPNYEQVIPKKNEYALLAETQLLLQATRRVSTMASDKSNSVKLVLKTNSLTLTSNTPDVGEAEEEMEVVYKGPEMTLAYNAKYLVDVLKVVETEKTEFRLSSALNPALIKPQGGGDEFEYVVMPMRI